MEVKEVKQLNYIPNVFLDPYLNKFSVIKDFVDCGKYVSRSGLTFSGCLKVKEYGGKLEIDTIREAKGIYYVRHKPILSLSYRQKAFRIFDEVKKVLSTIDFLLVIPKQSQLLIAYDNYSVKIYDIYIKGRRYEFPLRAQQGHLSIYQVPPIKHAYVLDCQGQPVGQKMNEELFEKTKELTIYNHQIVFESEVLKYKNLYVTPGSGELVFVPNSMVIKLQSPDHGNVEFSVPHDTWLLFSHRVPPGNSVD